MKIKIFFLVICTSVINFSFAQKQKFDIATFIPPQGWQRMDTMGTVAFIHSKNENGLTRFCQIILYASTNSSGNANKDFEAAWNNLVTVPAKSNAKPTVQTEKTPEGWTVVSGAASITNMGFNYNSIVATISGFGKTMNVQVNLAGNDYSNVIQKFFNDLDLDSKGSVMNNNQPTNQMKTTVSLNDMDFVTPQGWQLQKHNDHWLIQNPQSGCAIRMLIQPSSGDIEKDANTVFDVMFAGWQYQKSGNQQYVLSKGFLHQGLEYFMKEAAMTMTDANGRYHLEEGAALIVKANAQIAIIAVRHNTSLMAHDGCYRNYNTWRRFFNSFTVKTISPLKNSEDVSARIIGSWSQTESGASSEYVFAANGNYAFYGALGNSYTSKDYNYEYLHIKTYAFQGDGSYTLAGNQLNLKKRNGNNEQIRFRFEKVNHGGVGWKDRLYLMKTDRFGENEVCYEKR